MALNALAAGAAILLTGAAAHAAAGTALGCSTFILAVGRVASRRAVDEMAQHLRMFNTAQDTTRQIEELFAMTDMLQAAEDHDEAGAVLMAASQRLLPDFDGALYVFNNSRDRLDLTKSWGGKDKPEPAASLLPSNCWAVKRGKAHINDAENGTLCCMHPVGPGVSVEMPMMARGQVFGLLILTHYQRDAYENLRDMRRIARALTDSMSLALSNIALREKLHTQSLRDPLTGLYNRRYMEDSLERYISLAERTGSATSVLMIDLDNFKRLNDEYGHAKGDAVLRDVAGQLVGALRPSDVVARYGGEELMVILPNCSIEDATAKAEMLRMRIENLSEVHGAPISASFGVACVPETAGNTADVVPVADAALYAAKEAGKNRVVASRRRIPREDASPPCLAVNA
ncbi:sensor domain-containing diguanylate cyclase [Novosphingobium beihaiensis]|uniref:diguanylate cyclase n=1 Tax=Novosphingobium beihaiensis TaxID=2930389 RepID=A0ABT0BW03_9SPHN|nr:sensor domain-containing diguanylate cyclase [Novosphingobium beihaiensis]MCJ2189236.1 sensor domain-containing diguanylate cyclase [Novosphingobium beihaiensis]